ncbi:WS/DGAT domain-containing protein [Streptomyces sp. Qhu-G9]|uniref:wax ester/triacylglycerol synthase domain-containing protein n=1 Tax=Streptomyces sp. Qhu-G9 TaxID=3452799 RepID=UPI0022AC360C|nr:wax ester/triacylglycerol synthase domain-containing protein [Streptomyces aurantiacus]WAU85154.1 WS/DGAT domain-containing protein [Streptomyces aurantiacus]
MKHPLNPIDEVFLAMDRELSLAQGQFLRFRGEAPSLDELHDHLAERLPGLPRLTHRAVTGRRGAFRAPSAGFDLRDHVQEMKLPAGTSLDEVLTALVRLPLSGSGPLWSIRLVHGYADGEYAVCYRVHHGLEDGMGAAHVAAVLFGGTPRSGPTPRDGQRDGLRTGPVCTAGPLELLHGTLSVGAGMVRGLAPGRLWPRTYPGPENLAMCSTSATRRELSELGRGFGGTVNDAFLMALWGALSAWSATGDGRRDARSVFRASPVPVRMPLSTRQDGEEDAVGNHLTTAVVTLPSQELPPAEAFAQLVGSTQRMRSNGLRPASRALIALLPAALIRWTVRRLLSPRSSPLYASNYLLPASLSFRGDQVVDAIPLGVLLPGNALSVTLLSCGSRVQVSFLYDRRLPDAQRLAALWREALDELDAINVPHPA